MNIRKSYNPNYVKLNSNACEATETNHKNNLQPSAKDNQINQIETNSEKSSNESNPSKKLKPKYQRGYQAKRIMPCDW